MSEYEIGDEAFLDCEDFSDEHAIKEWHGCKVVILNKIKQSVNYYYDVKVPAGFIFRVLECCLWKIPVEHVIINNPTHPDHYKQGGLEPIDYMRMKMSEEAFRGFCIGNVIKYVSRYEHKNGLEDLKKAQAYLGWAIGTYDEDKEEDEA